MWCALCASHRGSGKAPLVRDDGFVAPTDTVITSIRQFHELGDKVLLTCIPCCLNGTGARRVPAAGDVGGGCQQRRLDVRAKPDRCGDHPGRETEM